MIIYLNMYELVLVYTTYVAVGVMLELVGDIAGNTLN